MGKSENYILGLDVSTKTFSHFNDIYIETSHMDSTVYIYALIDPRDNQIRYIGKSINPKLRLRKHISERNLHDSYKDRWLRQLINDEFRPELKIIYETNKNEWQKWEIFYINYYKEVGCRLTNGTIGGDQPPSSKGRKHTEEAKVKMSKTKKGKAIPWLNNGEIRTEEHKNNLSKSCLGRKSEKTGKTYEELYGENKSLLLKNKLSEIHKGQFSGDKHPMYGKNHSEGSKIKISKNSLKNRPYSFKIIQQYDKNWVLIKEWESISLATNELKINNISACCSGKLKSAGGYKWKYKNG